MVLWEIALGTAYFLGIRRSYRLSLKLQRRLISARHPQLRLFVYKRVRTVFDMALKVHKNIQQRDLDVRRNLGNWILRWLDKMKPSAEIRVDAPKKITDASQEQKKFVTYKWPTYKKPVQNLITRSPSLFSRFSIRARPFPTFSMLFRPTHPTSLNSQYRQMVSAPSAYFNSQYRQMASTHSPYFNCQYRLMVSTPSPYFNHQYRPMGFAPSSFYATYKNVRRFNGGVQGGH